MGMSVGDKGGLTNEPNVVPMIDILLVLLIIFMIMQPLMRKAIDIQLPDPQPAQTTSTQPPNQIVLEVGPNDYYAINTKVVEKERLGEELKAIYDPRPDKIMFLKGDPTVTFQTIIHAMDVARGAGVKVIGVPPGESEQE